jgi:hypothetical protein
MKSSTTSNTRRQFMTRTMAVGMTAAITACGGGGGGGGGGIPFGGLPSGGVDPDGGDGESAFTADERSAITRRAHDKYEELMAAHTPDAMLALGQWMRTQPEYTDAGASADSAWARFTDGRYFLYTDGWRPVTLSTDDTVEPELRAGDRLAKAGLVAGKKEIPGSDLAVIMSADDGDSFDEVKGMQQKVAKMLQDQGWRIHGDRSFTVESMLALANVEMGIFYLAAHGGIFGPSNQKEYCFITETRATAENEAKYRADFRTGRLIYNRDRNLEKEASGEKLPPCFAVTASFVQKYLKFSDGALAVTLCCHSGSPEAEAFRGALAGGKAVTIVGWDGSGNDYGARSMEYMFDRLTSANTRNPAAPHNRAFDMDDVWEYMGRTATRDIRPNLLVSPEVWERWEVPKGDAYIKRFGNGFDLSNPVIAELETDYGDKLVLHGNFGSEQGVVSVGGTELAVQTWENDKIELVLPTGKSDPAGSHGDVVVTARKRKSNRRVLTSWRGTVTYLYEDLAPEGDEGTLYNKVEIDFHMRGDAHARRTEVSGELRANTWNLALASDSTATYRAAGERRSGGHVLKSYSGSGDLSYVDRAQTGSGTTFSMIGRVDAPLERMELMFFQPLDRLMTQTDASGNAVKRSMVFPAGGFGFVYEQGSGGDHMPLAYGTYLPLDAGANVLAYSKAIPIEDEPLNPLTVTVSAMTASPPFDDTVGR